MSLESFDSQLVATMEDSSGQPMEETPFRVALLGDWSGRSNRGNFATGSELANWRPLLVDRDNLDQLMARLGVELHLPLTSASNSLLALQFEKLEDFHPDRIFERAELFQALRDTRTRLSNPQTFEQAREEVRVWAPQDQLPKHAQEQLPATAEANLSGDSLLDKVLELSDERPGRPTEKRHDPLPDISSLVQEVVRPFLLPDESEQESLIAAVDKAISEEMRAILHNPEFQSLEGSWRALDFLTSRLDTGSQLKLYLLDISLPELQAALVQNDEVQETGIYRLLVENSVETFGGEPWAVLAGNYFFEFTTNEAELLKRLAIVANAAIAPFIGGAGPSLLSCESLSQTPDPDDWQLQSEAETEQAWDELQRSPVARFVGLAVPRFLLRLPYGHDTDPAEEFSFEEIPEGTALEHSRYLWANPVFAITYLLGQAYSHSGWALTPGDVQEIDGLPIHTYKADGDMHIKPCAEVLMTVRAAQRIVERGLMPVITIKDTGTIRVGSFQSLAKPGRRLAGRWAR